MVDARDGLNLAALAAAVALSACVGLWWWRPPAPTHAETGAVVGADGVGVPAGGYRAIVSLDPAADDALVALGALERLRAISAWSAGHAIHAHELAGVRARVEAGAGAEAIAALGPDLVLIGSTSDPVRTARLRAGGLRVFACGGEGTAADVAAAVRRLGAVIGEERAGEALADRFRTRLDAVAGGEADGADAAYCADYAGRLYGAAAGTAIHDIIVASGMRDAAAARGWKDFPAYHLEDVVAMHPRYLVTGTDSAALLSALPGIDQLHGTTMLVVDGDLLQITGVGMVEAAQALRVAYLAARGRADAAPMRSAAVPATSAAVHGASP